MSSLETLLGFLLAGLGGGAVVASLALGLVLSFRSSGVINFAHAAMGMYVAYAFFEFRETGDLVLPILGLPDRVHLLARPTLASALAVAIVLGAVVGVVVYLLVFRPLRRSPVLARVVASLGLLLYLQEVVRIRFPVAGASVTERRPVLPEDPVRLAGTAVSQNRLLLVALVVVVTAALALLYRATRFGLATRATAGNEKGSLLLGISPDRLGAINWAIASVLAGVAVILIEPISGLDPTTTPLLVVPALAAALLGRLQSFAIAAAAGIGIGMLQSTILGYAVRPSAGWIPDWLPVTGLQQLVPVVVIVGALIWGGARLPDRSAVVDRRLPVSPTPHHVTAWTLGGCAAVTVGLLTFSAGYRQALIVSMVFAVLALSVVVVTGYVGQISLAQLAFAGVSGFAVIRLDEHGVPFVLAALLAAGLSALLGVLVGLPATRVRGMTLALSTLALAVAIEQLVLASRPFSGGPEGSSAPRPYLFGWDVGVAARGADNFRPEFGLLVLGVLALCCVAVANLRRNQTGLRWLAVRSNERAAAAAGIDVGRTKLGAFATSSFIAGLAGVLMAESTTTLSPASFMVVGALVALALTYLGGIASISGALVAGLLAQAGLLTTLSSALSDGDVGRYVFATSGIALILTAILAPDGVTGLVRRGLSRRRPIPQDRDQDLPQPERTDQVVSA